MQIDHTVIFGGIAALCTVVGLGLAFIGRDRSLQSQIVSGDRNVTDFVDREIKSVEAKIDQVHTRINMTRDDFVRRDDLKTHMEQVEKQLKQMYDSQQGTNKRIDVVLDRMIANDDRRAK